MHTVTPDECIWVRACGGKWHRCKPGTVVQLGYCAFPPCGAWTRPVMQVRTTRPDEGRCQRCDARAK